MLIAKYEGAGSNQRSSVDESVSGAGAEAADIGTGSVVQAGNLSSSLGEVAAAALVHVAASLFAAVNHILNIVLVNTGVLQSSQQSQNGGCLGNHVLMHDMSGQVHIDVVSAVDTANQNIVVIQALGVLLSNQTSDLGAVDMGSIAPKSTMLSQLMLLYAASTLPLSFMFLITCGLRSFSDLCR